MDGSIAYQIFFPDQKRDGAEDNISFDQSCGLSQEFEAWIKRISNQWELWIFTKPYVLPSVVEVISNSRFTKKFL
jgi:hypothetical protein